MSERVKVRAARALILLAATLLEAAARLGGPDTRRSLASHAFLLRRLLDD